MIAALQQLLASTFAWALPPCISRTSENYQPLLLSLGVCGLGKLLDLTCRQGS
jgi:hypothetical protein